MKRFLTILLTALVLSSSILVPCYAWDIYDPFERTGDKDHFDAYWSTEAHWTMDTGFDRSQYVTLSEYNTYGQPISITPDNKNKNTYPECADLDDVDLVARVIYAEICNLTDIRNNAYAVAQVIKTRMGSNRTARQVVTEKCAFTSTHDGNTRFADTSLDNAPNTWAECVFLAGCLVEGDDIPLIDNSGNKYGDDIGSRWNFCDISDKITFYTSSKKKCTSSNIESEAYYVYRKGYKKITKSPIKIGNHVYFSY